MLVLVLIVLLIIAGIIFYNSPRHVKQITLYILLGVAALPILYVLYVFVVGMFKPM